MAKQRMIDYMVKLLSAADEKQVRCMFYGFTDCFAEPPCIPSLGLRAAGDFFYP